MGCTFESNTRRSRIAIAFRIFKTEIPNNRGKDVFSNKKRKEILLLKPLGTCCFNRKYNFR